MRFLEFGSKRNKAIIDCGPVVPMNTFILNFCIRIRLNQIHRMKKGNKHIYNALNHSYMPTELVDETMKVGANMSDETCRNVHESVYGYALPTSLSALKTDIAYWYGSKESWFGDKYAKAIRAVLPHVKVKIFQGYEHGELCIGKPKLFIKEASYFFEV